LALASAITSSAPRNARRLHHLRNTCARAYGVGLGNTTKKTDWREYRSYILQITKINVSVGDHTRLGIFKIFMKRYCRGTFGHPVRKRMHNSLFRCRIRCCCRSFAGQGGVPVQKYWVDMRGEKKVYCRKLGLKASTQAAASRTVKAHFDGAQPCSLLILRQNR